MTVHVLQHLRGTDDDCFCILSIPKVSFQEHPYEAPMMQSGGNSGLTAESLTAFAKGMAKPIA
jgi:hypothetical protein